MTNLLETIRSQLLEEESYEKTSFWASEFEKDTFDIFHRWMGTPPTNPIDAEKMIVFSAGKMMEMALIEKLRPLGIVIAPENIEDAQTAFRVEREGCPISGKLDAIIELGQQKSVLEIKTYYGDYQDMELSAGKARLSYLKQLACYLDAMSLDLGHLVYLERGTGQMYDFILRRKEGLLFECVSYDSKDQYGKHPITTSFDLTDDYKRFASIYKNYILPKKEPSSDYTYKYNIASVNWTTLPASKISKARNGQAVVGDWQVIYSPYKDLIVAKEALKLGKTLEEYLGYSDEELARICELTKGYTSKKKSK